MRYAVVGYGRMGRAIDEEAERRGHRREAIVDPDHGEVALESAAAADVAFEFTSGASAPANVAGLLGRGVSVVCGTTGWSPGVEIDEALARGRCGLVLAPNFSIGMGVFARLVGEAAGGYARAGLYEPYVLEAHHRAKRDVPSGTARRLARRVREADPRLRATVEGHPDGALAPGALQVVGIRAGHEFGRHTVGFDGPDDCITLTHRARGRAGFARGAVLAAEWLAGRSGRFDFDDVLDDLLGADGRRDR